MGNCHVAMRGVRSSSQPLIRLSSSRREAFLMIGSPEASFTSNRIVTDR